MPPSGPRPHPLNRAFSWSAPRLPFQILSEDQAQSYDQHGYFLLEGAFTDEEIDDVEQAIAPFEKKSEDALRAYGKGISIARADQITFTVHLVKSSNVLKQFSRHPVFQRLCHDLLGTRARLYWDQAVYKKPGNPEEFPWHQDNGYTYVEPQQYLTCWVPLTEATLDNGCPWVAPGLHKSGTFDHWDSPNGKQCLTDPEGPIAVPAKRGDIVVFSSLTPHRTGPNLTAQTRKTYVLQYAPDGSAAFPEGLEGSIQQNDEERQYLIT